MAYGNFLYHRGYCVCFRNVLFQKLHSCRSVEKYIGNTYSCSYGAARFAKFYFLRAGNFVACTDLLIGRTGQKLNLCNCGNRSHSFASKAERCYFVQILAVFYLRGCVRNENLFYLTFCDSAAVVGYAHIGCSAVFDFNGYAFCTGVNRVFYHFLNHGRRSFYNLACGNKLINLFRQNINFGHIPHFLSVIYFGNSSIGNLRHLFLQIVKRLHSFNRS